MNNHYIDHYVFPKQGGGGGVSLSHLVNPAILTTSLLIGGSSDTGPIKSCSGSRSINPPTLGTEIFVPGGLVFIPDHSFQETREFISTDPFMFLSWICSMIYWIWSKFENP